MIKKRPLTNKTELFIIFDYDGVIVDSAETIKGIMDIIGLPVINKADFQEVFSGRQLDILRHFNLSRTQIGFLFLRHWKKILGLLNNTPLQPGVELIIPSLSKEYTLAINSSAPSWFIRRILRKNNLLQHFSLVRGGGAEWDKVKKFHQILKKLGFSKHNTLFVTDTSVDIEDAQKAGIKVIAITTGFDTKQHLQAKNPLHVIDSLDKLLTILNDTKTKNERNE